MRGHICTKINNSIVNWECLALHAVKPLKGEDVVGVMEGLLGLDKRLSAHIQTDNSSKSISKSLDKMTLYTIRS